VSNGPVVRTGDPAGRRAGDHPRPLGDQAQGRGQVLAGQQCGRDVVGGGQPPLAPLDLFEQGGVLDRDTGRRGERDDDLLVRSVNSPPPRFSVR